MRIGFGYDVHPFLKGRDLVLAGTKIPYEKGLAGHSDADVVAHAIADALLGAAGLGGIEDHFPDTDMQYKNFQSLEFLKEIEKKIHFQKYKIMNIDVTVVIEKPKILPFKKEMERRIADSLFLKSDPLGDNRGV